MPAARRRTPRAADPHRSTCRRAARQGHQAPPAAPKIPQSCSRVELHLIQTHLGANLHSGLTHCRHDKHLDSLRNFAKRQVSSIRKWRVKFDENQQEKADLVVSCMLF